MRIERRQKDRRQVDSLGEALRAIIHRAKDGRPCGTGCRVRCPTCGATDCRCACARTCGNIPRALSSDPDTLPIETGIAPLVYEMNTLGVFRPCWSCEGHLDSDGAFWKPPRVWFYCGSPVHVRLLSDTMEELRIRKVITVPWRVRVTFSDDDNPETTFSIKPETAHLARVELSDLQADIAAIAEHLGPVITEQALKLTRKTKTQF